MNKFQPLIDKLDQIMPLVKIIDDNEVTALSKFLADRIIHPDSYVTFLGETSSGKSTIINGLIGNALLPVKACPTTGSISEIELTQTASSPHYFAINKDATIEEVDRSTCIQLIEHPDEELERVKIQVPCSDTGLQNMRIFDTPGYDSVVEEHEEILKEFLPNSDIVIYTVSYKIGVQENDYAFLGFLRELVRDDVEIILVINRCPQGITNQNRRVLEICKYVQDALGIKTSCFMIPGIQTANENEYPLPSAMNLWKHVAKCVRSEKRMNSLYQAFDTYINEFFDMCYSIINQKYVLAKLDNEHLSELDREQKNAAQRIRDAIPAIIEPGFQNVIDAIPRRIHVAAENVSESIQRDIDDTSTGEMDEMIAYTNSHLLPYYIRKESDEVQRYIETMLTQINEQVDDYINKEIQEFNNSITIRIKSYKDVALSQAGAKLTNRVLMQGLLKYFTKYGGAGGANAGIANAASHLLKRIGDLFGKTFSRQTHNALKHTLARIGATTMKAVGYAVTVVIELAMLAIEYGTWKSKLKKQINKAVAKWETQTGAEILDELQKLKQENIHTIYDIADEIANTFDMNVGIEENSLEEIEKQISLCETIKKQIGES